MRVMILLVQLTIQLPTGLNPPAIINRLPDFRAANLHGGHPATYQAWFAYLTCLLGALFPSSPTLG